MGGDGVWGGRGGRESNSEEKAFLGMGQGGKDGTGKGIEVNEGGKWEPKSG